MLGGIWVIFRRIGKKIPSERRTLEIRKWWQKIGIQIPWNSVSIGKLTISINRFDKIQLKNQHSRKNRHCSVWTKIKHSSDLADARSCVYQLPMWQLCAAMMSWVGLLFLFKLNIWLEKDSYRYMKLFLDQRRRS